MKKLSCLSFLIVFLLTGCVKEVDLDVPQYKSQLTLNGIFQANQNYTAIGLSASNSFTNTQRPPYISTAQVEFSLNNQAWLSLGLCDSSAGEPANRYCLYQNLQAGDRLEIRAQSGDFDNVWATTVVPEAPQIESLSMNENVVTFTLQNPTSQNHYYAFEFIDDSGIEQQFSTKDPSLELLGSANDLIDLPIDDSFGIVGFLKSRGGQESKRDVRVELNSFSNNTLKLHIYSCSYDYYEYLRTKLLSKQFNDNPFNQPVQYHSNVENGLGLVGAYSDLTLNVN